MEIVAVQPDIIWEDKSANHNKIRTLLDSATIAPQSLIVLPEMFDTGFSMDIQATAQDDARESERFLKELAREHQSAVLAGIVGPILNGVSSNEAVALDAEGTELVRYRKMQPFTPLGEDKTHGAGDAHRLFAWQEAHIAPFICYDLRFPEIFRPAARDGAEIIIVVASWPAVRSEHWVRLLQARAIENQAIVIGVNRCGADPNMTFDGRSTAFDALGKSLWEADGSEQVKTLTLDIAAVRQWRQDFPALRDMRA